MTVTPEKEPALSVNRANSCGRGSLLPSVSAAPPPTTISLPPLKSAFLAEVNRTHQPGVLQKGPGGSAPVLFPVAVHGGETLEPRLDFLCSSWLSGGGESVVPAGHVCITWRHFLSPAEGLCRVVASVRTRSLTPS